MLKVVENLDSTKYEFTIVGDGNYRTKIDYIFRRNNVHYLGWVQNKKTLSKIYQEHDVLLNPSIKYKDWEELFGIVNIEAMASGLVVIASKHVGPKEIIEHEVNGYLVEENNHKIIVKILKKLYGNRELLESISTKAIKMANNFSLQNISKQWSNVLNGK